MMRLDSKLHYKICRKKIKFDVKKIDAIAFYTQVFKYAHFVACTHVHVCIQSILHIHTCLPNHIKYSGEN